MNISHWICDKCDHCVFFDGAHLALFLLEKSGKDGRYHVFSRGLADEVLLFVIISRSSFACATRFFAQVLRGVRIDRQLVTRLGREYGHVIHLVRLLFACPCCGDAPELVIMDGQSVGFLETAAFSAHRVTQNVPVLGGMKTDLIVIVNLAAVRDSVKRVTRNGAACTERESKAMEAWAVKYLNGEMEPFEASAATLFFFFFPFNQACLDKATGVSSGPALLPRQVIEINEVAEHMPAIVCVPRPQVIPHEFAVTDVELMDLVREVDEGDVEVDVTSEDQAAADDTDGEDDPTAVGVGDSAGNDLFGAPNVVAPLPRAPAPAPPLGGRDITGDVGGTQQPLGGRALGRLKEVVPWSTRTGMCAPSFGAVLATDILSWDAVRRFVRALVGEPVIGLLLSCHTREILHLAEALRDKDGKVFRAQLYAVGNVSFLDEFFARTSLVLEKHHGLRVAVSALLVFGLKVEHDVDAEFKSKAEAASRNGTGSNMEYAENWMVTSKTKFAEYVDGHKDYKGINLEDPVQTMEVFPALPRVRPAVRDNGAAMQRLKYKTQRGAAAAKEDEADDCNKDFTRHKNLTPCVFNVVCEHVITLGFRVLDKAESIEDGLSILLERFPVLPQKIFYDVACKFNRNAMRRIRPFFRQHNVRAWMDRAHGPGHTCSLINFADSALHLTFGRKSNAAEVSHSVAEKYRSSLAHMSPSTFVKLKSLQVAWSNLRAIYTLKMKQKRKETDHHRHAEFFHEELAEKCAMGPSCPCRLHHRPV